MTEYHKIQNVFQRDPDNKNRLIEGRWSTPELRYLAENEWIWTEKVDGTNIRVILDAGEVRYAGRTNAAQIPVPLVNRLNKIFQPIEKDLWREFQQGAVFYGEGYGDGIQSGRKYLDYQDFVLFDIRVGKWWLNRDDVTGIARHYGLRVVPFVGSGSLYDAIAHVKEGFNSVWGNFPAEGIVARPDVELQTRGGERIITKIKARDFK
jgi:ATP-dependent RNA circularization protein (DNA/RNA ligase family)